MDNVVTSIFVLEGHGKVVEYVGGYSRWAGKGGKLVNLEQQDAASVQQPGKPKASKQAMPAQSKKLTYKDKRELESLPVLIEKLESRQAEIESEMAAEGFYQQDHAVTQVILEQLASTQLELDAAYARWEKLEDHHV
jgi:ATP-binding cassette subfamily F protein uup